jgi:Asp-tRNA(Asn)/Glu-tRNA(Gln) amidotransferase A subunit family amidase
MRRPADDDALAFLTAAELGALIHSRQISSEELTTFYLERLRRYDPQLHCVITLTEERALAAARRADRELGKGKWRGPLHGVPWGAKDLLSVKGYPTTWGAKPYLDQVIDEDATVVSRLDEAGAVLVAKLTLGALAWGDVWFGGTTRNPWNTEQGSSGSSAGPASATAAGLVGFSVGSETWGSIVSPSTRCGVSGLRPTFGRVSRHGAMALSWSMDKLGPICRSVEDCGLVMEAIHGADGLDPTAVDRPYAWGTKLDLSALRFGYLRSDFERELEFGDGDDEAARQRAQEWRRFDLESLETIRSLGMELVPLQLPDIPVGALSFILSAEAGAAFDELTRSGRDDELVRQIENAWPNVFRQSRTIPAVEYIQANRVRTVLMRKMEELLAGLDGWLAPSIAGDNLLLTNLTGHPSVVLPNGFCSDGTPTSFAVNGRLFGETEILAVAHSYQSATGFHLRRPEGF